MALASIVNTNCYLLRNHMMRCNQTLDKAYSLLGGRRQKYELAPFHRYVDACPFPPASQEYCQSRMPWNPDLLALSHIIKLTQMQMIGCSWYFLVLVSRAHGVAWKQRIKHFFFRNLVPSLFMLTFTCRKMRFGIKAVLCPVGWSVESKMPSLEKVLGSGCNQWHKLLSSSLLVWFCCCCCYYCF